MKRFPILILALLTCFVAGLALLAQDEPSARGHRSAGRDVLFNVRSEASVAAPATARTPWAICRSDRTFAGVDAVRIEGALEGAEEMEFLLPLLTDAATSRAWRDLPPATWEPSKPASTLVRGGAFDPAELTLSNRDSTVQVIVNNGNRSECTFELSKASRWSPSSIGGRAAGDVVFTAPEEPGTMEADFCAEDRPRSILTLSFAVPDAE